MVGNCANIFLWLRAIPKTSILYPILTFTFIAIVAAILAFIIVHVYKTRKNKLELSEVIMLSAFIPMVCVFFMPKMLDRYFYVAEIFMFVYLMIASEKKMTRTAYLLFEFGVLITYAHYFALYKIIMLQLDSSATMLCINLLDAANIFTGIAVVLMFIRFVRTFAKKQASQPQPVAGETQNLMAGNDTAEQN